MNVGAVSWDPGFSRLLNVLFLGKTSRLFSVD
jgi:hypothetical protein